MTATDLPQFVAAVSHLAVVRYRWQQSTVCLLVENRNFCLSHLHSTPLLGGLRRNIAILFVFGRHGKREWWKVLRICLVVYTYDGQTDILLRCSQQLCIALCDKNVKISTCRPTQGQATRKGHEVQAHIYSLTHSLVDLPRWGLATADDHSDIFLLHCARSCDISFSWMYSQPVHSSMSCIHCLLGLPWCRSPSMIPSRTVSANCPALLRVIWPKYCSFSFATLPIKHSAK